MMNHLKLNMTRKYINKRADKLIINFKNNMEKENSFYSGSMEETGAHLIDIREFSQWDPIQEMQEQINHEIDENLEKEAQLREYKEDKARSKKLWEEIMAKIKNEKEI